MVLPCKEFTVSCGNKRNPPNAYNTMQRNNTREIGAKHHGGYEGERHGGWGHSARVFSSDLTPSMILNKAL